MSEVSIVIRVLNEAQALEMLFESLRAQHGINQGAIEVVVVDNGSTDGTREVAERFGAKIVHLPKNEFTYPKASNIGIRHASAPLIVMMSAHSLPLNDQWLATGLRHFTDQNIAGVFGLALPNTRCGPLEWLGHEISYWLSTFNSPKKITKMRMGMFTARNCIIRKSLWLQHPFDETYQLGGEDVQWARWALSQSYCLVRDSTFTVRHSHGVPLRGYWRQFKLGMQMKRPTTFSREALAHRDDLRW